VRFNGRVYEAVADRLGYRRVRDLYHSALELRLPEGRCVVELAPTPDRDDSDRGVVAEGAMWNSNSLISWLIAAGGLDDSMQPPAGGRAPDWNAGLVLGRRHRDSGMKRASWVARVAPTSAGPAATATVALAMRRGRSD
jgi:hypothetical protein